MVHGGALRRYQKPTQSIYLLSNFLVLENDEYMEGDNLLKASKFAQLALEVPPSSYARYESVEVVTAVLFRLVPSH